MVVLCELHGIRRPTSTTPRFVGRSEVDFASGSGAAFAVRVRGTCDARSVQLDQMIGDLGHLMAGSLSKSKSGLDALSRVAIEPFTAVGDEEGYVCTLGYAPNPASDGGVGTPPVDGVGVCRPTRRVWTRRSRREQCTPAGRSTPPSSLASDQPVHDRQCAGWTPSCSATIHRAACTTAPRSVEVLCSRHARRSG
jgi:hypothetical protein